MAGFGSIFKTVAKAATAPERVISKAAAPASPAKPLRGGDALMLARAHAALRKTPSGSAFGSLPGRPGIGSGKAIRAAGNPYTGPGAVPFRASQGVRGGGYGPRFTPLYTNGTAKPVPIPPGPMLHEKRTLMKKDPKGRRVPLVLRGGEIRV